MSAMPTPADTRNRRFSRVATVNNKVAFGTAADAAALKNVAAPRLVFSLCLCVVQDVHVDFPLYPIQLGRLITTTPRMPARPPRPRFNASWSSVREPSSQIATTSEVYGASDLR